MIDLKNLYLKKLMAFGCVHIVDIKEVVDMNCPKCGKKMKLNRQKQDKLNCDWYSCDSCGEYHDK